MNTAQRIAKNTIVLLVAQIVSMTFGFFYTMYMARYLGAEGFGTLSFALAFTSIFCLFADLGLGSLTIREVARNKALANKYIGNISVIKVGLAIFAYILIVLVSNLMGYPEQTLKVIQLISLSVICNAFTSMFCTIFQALEKMEYVSLGRILNSVLMLALTIIAINQGLSVVGLAFIYLGVSVFGLFYSLLIYILKLGMIKPEFDWLFLKPTINAALPFFLSALVDTIAFKIDIVMLSSMKGDIVVGWYSAAYRLLEVMMFVPATFGGSIFPVFSKFYVSSQESLKLAYKKSFEYLSIIALPISVGTTILAEKIIFIIYAENYGPSITALRILIWTIPVIFLAFLMGTMLASINKQALAVKINLFGMLLNILINFILIPKYSLYGASIATVFTSSAALLLGFYFISAHFYKLSIFRFILKLAMSSIIMSLFTLYYININIILLTIISAMIYVVVLVILNTFSKEDVTIVKSIIHRNKLGATE
jgi:O-antigen/teichoic acid export membrane protein